MSCSPAPFSAASCGPTQPLCCDTGYGQPALSFPYCQQYQPYQLQYQQYQPYQLQYQQNQQYQLQYQQYQFNQPPPCQPALTTPQQQPADTAVLVGQDSPARPDLGYESDSATKQQQQQQQRSRSDSACDSARPDSPAASDGSDLTQLAEDLKGFCMSGGPRPVDMALSQQMEVVWHERFAQFFGRLPYGEWHLIPVFDPPDVGNTGIPRNQWRYCRDQAKVRFICNSCQKAWTSMAGQVVFWIYKDDRENAGYIHFKLYGQKCSECDAQFYEHAIWYQEEVEKVMENLYHHVGHLYYGMRQQKRRVDRRAGHPKKEHSSSTCQACSERVCRLAQRKKARTEPQ